MTRGSARWEALLWVGVALLALLHLFVREDFQIRRGAVFTDMVDGAAYDAFAPNPNFPDSKTLRTPPEGSIARGYAPLLIDGALLDVTTPLKVLPESEKLRWDRLLPPWSGAESSPEEVAARQARGGVVFDAVCANCHGSSGAGGAIVTKRRVPPPPSLLEPHARDLSDGVIFRIITVGGFENMPSHASQVEREDRWKVIQYLRSLQTP